MEALNQILPVILYILLAILIVVVIIFVLKLITILDNANVVVKNVENKINKFNGAFEAVDKACDALSFASDKVSTFITNSVKKIIERKEDNNE